MYTNDVLCRSAFGRGYSVGGDYDRQGFRKMLDDVQGLLGGFSIGEFFPSMEFIHSLTGMKSRLRDTFRRIDQLFDEIIKEHLNRERVKEEHKDFVDVLLDMHKNEEGEIPFTMDNVKGVMLAWSSNNNNKYEPSSRFSLNGSMKPHRQMGIKYLKQN
ncbi:Cytochrome P450 [Dillenia turbinata]|uniref:Cytochrome P450 n=1 Tax=Dillenia turbinata TaxID=194707 RepID=A0AAN8V0K3_9MAGN